MHRFHAGEIDLLLATAIVGAGLDVPRANTLVVDRADRFGLADLYQLKGRVGRSDRRAFAYFLVPARGPDHRGGEAAPRGADGALVSRRGVPAGAARPGDPRGGRPARGRAVRPHRRDRLRPVPGAARRGGRRAQGRGAGGARGAGARAAASRRTCRRRGSTSRPCGSRCCAGSRRRATPARSRTCAASLPTASARRPARPRGCSTSPNSRRTAAPRASRASRRRRPALPGGVRRGARPRRRRPARGGGRAARRAHRRRGRVHARSVQALLGGEPPPARPGAGAGGRRLARSRCSRSRRRVPLAGRRETGETLKGDFTRCHCS